MPPKYLIITPQQHADGWYENCNGIITHHKAWPVLSVRLKDGNYRVVNPAYLVEREDERKRSDEKHRLEQRAREFAKRMYGDAADLIFGSNETT